MSPVSGRISYLLLLFVFWNISFLALDAQDAKKTSPGPQPDYSAEAYVVEESAERWNFEGDGTGTHENTARVRVQSDAGVQRFGLLTFPYQKANETIEVGYVRVRKPDGSIVPTPLDDVQDMPAKITQEAPYYSDLREKQVPVKGLSSGDVLELQCRWHVTKPLAPGQFWLSFQFPREEIVLRQKVQVGVPRDRAVKVKSPKLAPTVSEEGGYRVYTWTRSNLVRETTPKNELAQLVPRGRLPAPDVQLSSFHSWEELGRWYDELQRGRIIPTTEISERAAQLTRNAPDNPAKLRAIYKYVSTEFRYIGVAFGIGRYQPHFATEVLGNQYGDCKDKHTLMASLLAAAGIPAYPDLINSSHAVDPDVPSPAQFDHVITAVPQGKETFWLDTTVAVAPLGYLLPALRDKRALVIFSEKPAVFEATPPDPPFPTSWIFKIDAKLDDSGTLEGKVEQTLRGDFEVLVRTSLRSTSKTQWKDVIQQISYGIGFAGEVSDVFASLPESTETPLHFSYTYKRKDYPDWKQHRISPPVPTVFALPIEEDGKLPSNFWLGSPGEFRFESRVELPKGYSVDLPDKRDLQQGFAAYHSQYAQVGNVLVAQYRVEVKGREISGAAVNDYKTFAEKVHEDREQLIPLSSEKPQSAMQAAVKIEDQIWRLPDSSDPKALQAEDEARAAIQQGSLQGAIDGFKRAVAQDPKFTRDWLFLGQLYMASMQKDAAVDAFRKGLDSDPRQPLPYKVLAFALTSLGRRNESIRVWQDLAKVAPEDHDIPTNMGSLLIAEKRYREAVPYLETAVKLYPQSSRFLMLLATAYLQDGEDEKALGIFGKALQLEPGANTKNSIGYELADANRRLDDALRYAQEAVRDEEEASRKIQLSTLAVDDLRHTTSLGAYWDTLGWVHYRLGNLKEAEGYLHAAWTVLQDPVIGYHLGQVYEKQQRKQDALRMYRLVAGQRSRGAESVQAAADAQKRLERLDTAATSKGTHAFADSFAGEELGRERTISLPRLVSMQATAEFFVLLAPGPKVEDTKFISGSDQLKSAGKALAQAHFKISFPENSSGRVVRRGILACYPVTGCSFVLIPTEAVTRVE